MRRMLAMVAFSLLAALAVPTMASATHSNGQGPAQDFLSGAAKGPVPVPCAPGTAPGHFHTNGQAQDNVTNVATGQFWTHLDVTPSLFGYTQADFDGTVNCVNAYTVPANSATMPNCGRIADSGRHAVLPTTSPMSMPRSTGTASRNTKKKMANTKSMALHPAVVIATSITDSVSAESWR